MTADPGPLFAFALAAISLIGPLAVHLFMPVIPAVRAALGLSASLAQLTFSIALAAVATSVVPLVLGRLVQAIGAGSGLTLGRAIAQDVYGADRLVKAIAFFTMAYTIGPMISPVVGGILIDAFGWRSVFDFALLL